MIIKHSHFLDLAFQLAEKNLGKTSLNPVVGSVLVKDGSVISSGITSIGGRPHAEFNTLNKIKKMNGLFLYTTLEPCTHYGKTPPCTNIIIKKKIKKVFYAFQDPDQRTWRMAKKILRKKGVRTRLVNSNNYKNFYKNYFFNKKNNLPFITAKIASSADFFTISNKKWITNKQSRKIVHLLRSQNACIFSTSKSINTDNSLLDCRIQGLKKFNPALFILDMNLKLKKNLFLNKLINRRKTYLITKKSNKKKVLSYKKKGFRIIFIDSLIKKNDFIFLFNKIYKMGYASIFMETGLTFFNTLIKYDLIQRVYFFKNNKKLGKYGKNNDTSKYLKNIGSKMVNINLNDDKLYKKEF